MQRLLIFKHKEERKLALKDLVCLQYLFATTTVLSFLKKLEPQYEDDFDTCSEDEDSQMSLRMSVRDVKVRLLFFIFNSCLGKH